MRWIQALEAAQLADLPAEVFVAGYLRSYARAVGIDAQLLLERYHAHVKRSAQGEDGGGLKKGGALKKGGGKRLLWRQALLWMGLAAVLLLSLLAVAWQRGLRLRS